MQQVPMYMLDALAMQATQARLLPFKYIPITREAALQFHAPPIPVGFMCQVVAAAMQVTQAP
jgi:hypothetical protein